MKKISLVLAAGAFLLAFSASGSFAADNEAAAQKDDDPVVTEALGQLRGDYVLVVPGRNSATEPALLPYAKFVSLHGGSDDGSEIVQGDDGGESIVPTPGPPGTGIGFEPGDTVIFHRTNGPWTRTTTYRYMGSNIWYMQSNILKGPYSQVEE